MNKIRLIKALAMVAGFAVIASACAGMDKLGQYTIHDTYQDSRVVELVKAASVGNTHKVEKLAAGGVDVNAVGRGGATPLIWALHSKNYEGVEALLKVGANPNLYVPEFDFPAINLVSGGDEPKMLELLLKYGGDANNIGNGKILQRPLSLAAKQGRLINVKVLLAAGAELNAHDQFNESAATATLGPAHFEVLAYLLEQGYNYDLDRLARGVLNRNLPEGSKAASWKLKVIKMLKARGAKIP